MPADARPMTEQETAEAFLPLGRVLLRAMERYDARRRRDASVLADHLTGRATRKALPAPRRRAPGGEN